MLSATQSRCPEISSSHGSVIRVPLVTTDVVMPHSLAARISESSPG